jgi:DNA-binding response OmpR family regulator
MSAKMLIIDDDKLITAIYSDYFSCKGFVVQTSNSPFGVTSLVRTYCPDVIIIDVNLPGMNGNNLCTLLASKGHRQIVLISNETHEPGMKEMVSAGLAQEYFIKGRPLENLEAKISKLV